MKTLSPEQLRMLEEIVYHSARSAYRVTTESEWVAPLAERAAVNLDQVLMELDDE